MNHSNWRLKYFFNITLLGLLFFGLSACQDIQSSEELLKAHRQKKIDALPTTQEQLEEAYKTLQPNVITEEEVLKTLGDPLESKVFNDPILKQKTTMHMYEKGECQYGFAIADHPTLKKRVLVVKTRQCHTNTAPQTQAN